MYDVMSSYYMLISRSQGVPLPSRPHLEYAAAAIPSHLFPQSVLYAA